MALTRNIRSASHLPILTKIMSLTTGSVLELGSGFFSTPILYWLCKSQNREFVSYDNNYKWIRTVGYPIEYIKDWDNLVVNIQNWSMVLIDQKPYYVRKKFAIDLKDKADYIILHDSEEPSYGYEEIYPLFKYRYDYNKFIPHTTIVSNYYNLDNLL